MNAEDTAHLVERIVQTWPTGPKGRIWTEALTALDAGRAGAAYVRLRAEAEHPPSVARFLMTYRSLHTASADTAQQGCWECGDGWITREYVKGGRTYRGAFPCTCPTGQENQRIWDDISTANERQRKALNFEP